MSRPRPVLLWEYSSNGKKNIRHNLATTRYREHDASLARVNVSTEPEVSKSISKKSLKRTSETIVENNVKKFRLNRKVPEFPDAPTLFPWTVLPDSDEDTENYILGEEEPRYKHTIDDSTSSDITMDDTIDDQTLSMLEVPPDMIYYPYLVIGGSEENSGDEVLA
ncbi:hypothetical protein FLONG3_4095 [Fusarium longipes]|uniref:Uncharacterized protein n=1 Tax=Fusarium longipes TaxID=694270 RepID=A0A395SZ91_9HYPO|nr:hypothetical protein FLONG3_4095 [Fusarium longipes]